MIGRVGLTVCTLVLLAVTGVAAQQIVTGTVVRVDQPAHVLVLDNGQMYRATPQTVILVNDRPATFATIQPGTRVVFHSAQPVMYRDNQYVVLTHPAPAAVTHPAPAVGSRGLYEVSGIVKWVGASEPGRQSLTLDDGRHVWIDENTQVLANGAPAMLSTLRPGTFVVIRSTKPLAFRDNTYTTTTTTNTVVTTSPVAVAPTTVVTTPPQVVSGTVVRFEQPNMIVLSDGRAIPATTQTVVMVDNQPVPYATLRPGTPVVIYPHGRPVVVDGVSASPVLYPAGYPEIGVREKELERNSP